VMAGKRHFSPAIVRPFPAKLVSSGDCYVSDKIYRH
jgi:hypothetical protein